MKPQPQRNRNRRPIRRIVFHGLVILLFLNMGIFAVSSLMRDALGPQELVELWGRWRPAQEGERVRIRLDAVGRDREMDEAPLIRESNGFTPGASPDSMAAEAAGSAGANPRAAGRAARYFEPTTRLMDFLTAIDLLDRDATLESIEKFMAAHGGVLEHQELFAPVQHFHKSLAGGASLPQAVIGTLRNHGMNGKAALELIVKIKRDEYGSKLDKYIRLKDRYGVDKPHKIQKYEQKVWMVDELSSELAMSFR